MELSVPLTVMMNAIDGYSDVELDGWYLDRATGQLLCLWDAVAFVDDVVLSDEESEALYETVCADPERYLQLPDQRSYDCFERAAAFLDEASMDQGTRRALQKAVKKATRRGRSDCIWSAFYEAGSAAPHVLGGMNETRLLRGLGALSEVSPSPKDRAPGCQGRVLRGDLRLTDGLDPPVCAGAFFLFRTSGL